MFAWWTNPTPGIKYLRATLPAGTLGGVCLDIEDELADPNNNGNLWAKHPPDYPGIWQLVSNRVRNLAMREQRLFAPVYLDIDDDYTELYPEYAATRWVEFDHQTPDQTTSSVEAHRWSASFADGVIVTTPYLKQRYLQYNDNVYICRNSVNPKDWREPHPKTNDEFNIVFAGSPRRGDLEQCRRGLEWAARQPGVNVTMIDCRSMRFRGVKYPNWISDFSKYFDTLTDMRPDVSIRPLETTRFASSKSDLKVLEAAMSGAYPIVQTWTPYHDWIMSGMVGYASDSKSWEKEIKYAVNNRDEIRSKAAVLREHVIATRSIDVVKNDWVKVLVNAPQVTPSVGVLTSA